MSRPAPRTESPDDEEPVAAGSDRPGAPLGRGMPVEHALATLSTMDKLGPRLKELRQAAGLSLRELARQAEVSPSLVSQIENGKSRPSVSTLYTFARLLDVRVDELFDAEADQVTPAAPAAGTLAVASAEPPRPVAARHPLDNPANAWSPSEYATRISVVHPSHRAHIRMAEGVDWERLAATPERDVNFMKISYAPGAAATPDGSLMIHEGFEYGYVISGVLEVTIGDEVFVLREGESLGFDSAIPHLLRNVGTVPFHGIWFVHGNCH
ncbi:helix-turn-helix domain-containing protein [Modestobacter sp. SSW1-42]|uniref:helix-turn-helix domain-containing protein n=1 Tax=Modestobacter sp. SSW1-42 TaxID=596372 RepID=UPI003985F39C